METAELVWLYVTCAWILAFAVLIFGPIVQNVRRDRAEIEKLGAMNERRTKLLALIESGAIIGIHYGAERYYSENCHVESYFSVEGPGWTLWIACTTGEFTPEIDHSKVPMEVRAIFSQSFKESVRFVEPVLLQLKDRDDPSRTVKVWKREVGHAGPCDFGMMRPAKV